jgi:hypothetical protein
MINNSLPSTPNNIKARQITDADVPDVVALVTRGFGEARTHVFWAHVFDTLRKRSVPAGFPRYGYVLEIDGKIVGALLLIFSTQWVGGVAKVRCNVSSWYVDPEFRSYASLLASLALKFKNVTVLNVSAAPHTHAMHEASGFVRYVNGVVAAIPLLSKHTENKPIRIIDPHEEPDAPFEAHERELLLDHADFGCTSLWCVTPERAYPFVFRSRFVKSVLPCVQLIYCRDAADVVRFAKPLGLHFARRLKFLLLLDANEPMTGLVGKYYPGRLPKYCYGPDRPRIGDLAYTETAMFGI